MLARAYTLRQPINLFIASADERFGSITTLRRDGRVVKHIPWAAFKLSEMDWCRVRDAAAILAVRTFSTLYLLAPDFTLRILMRYSSTFHLRDSRRCGALCLQLRSFRPPGKRSVIAQDTRSTGLQLPMA